MNAKDLRIGNLVQEDVSGLSRNGIVNLIKNYRVSIKLPFSNLAIDTKNLKPIELTEEILEKLGFKNENINYVKNNVTIYFYDCWHFDYEDERGFNNVRLTGFWKVHQLQNLYFAITGEELVVSDAVSLHLVQRSSAWIICDPLSAYLNACGFKNKLQSYDENEEHCQVLILDFGFDILIPAGSDLNKKEITDWFWVSNLKKNNNKLKTKT